MFDIMNMKYLEKSVHYGTSLRCIFIVVNKGFVIICPYFHSKVIRLRELGGGKLAKGIAMWRLYIE